jgi:hypothetical protein
MRGTSTDTYQFNSTFNSQVLTVLGKVGVPLGPAGRMARWRKLTGKLRRTDDDRAAEPNTLVSASD